MSRVRDSGMPLRSSQPFSVLYSYPFYYLFFSFASSLSLSSLLFSTVTGLCCVSWVAVHEKEGGVRNYFLHYHLFISWPSEL